MAKEIHYLIYVDANGKEIKRERKDRGRPPKPHTRQGNDFLVWPKPEVKRDLIQYIDLNSDGEEIERKPKGKGRPKPEYKKRKSGQYKGHWVRIVKSRVPENVV